MYSACRLAQRRPVKKQKGLTLIELAIVGMFLGLLAIFVVTQFSGSATDSTKSAGLYEAAGKLSENWSLLSMQCGTTTDVTASPVGGTPASAAKNLSLLLGTGTVTSTYQSCYNLSGVKPLSGLSQGAAGSETIYGYTVTIANDGANVRRMAVSFANVPESLILPLYNKYSSASGAASATTLPAGADTTDAQIRFTAPSGGTRTLSIVKPL